jgi:hypothetical protein
MFKWRLTVEIVAAKLAGTLQKGQDQVLLNSTLK